jgi:site-specific recombinase XerD
MRKPTVEIMSDLLNSLSDTDGTAMPIAVESVNPTIISCAIAHSSGNSVTTETAIAITGNSTTIARAIAPGSTNPYLVYLSQLGAGSRRTMRESLEHIARMVSEGDLDASNFPWSELRYQHTQAIYTHLLETRAPATANKMMAAVGRVLKEAWKLGQMSAEDYHRAIAIERRTGQRLLKGRALSAGEIAAILSVCCQDDSVKGCRDAALIAVLYGAGVRRREVVALELQDWNSVDYCLTVRRGKGDKDRTRVLILLKKPSKFFMQFLCR